MDVEAKVKTLEQELKILKNQIQKTLLEIQEQILVHYYPTLRAETLEDLDQVKIKPVNQPQVDHKDEDVHADTLAKTGTNVLDTPSERLDTKSTSDQLGEGGPAAEPDVDPALFDNLVEWITSSMDTIGKDRIEQLVNIQMQNGLLPTTVGDTLIQLLALSGEEEPPGKIPMKEILRVQTELNELLRGALSGKLTNTNSEGEGIG